MIRNLDASLYGDDLRVFLNDRDAARLPLYCAAIADGDVFALVAEINGAAVGWAVVHLRFRHDMGWSLDGRISDLMGDSDAYLENLEVRPERRNSGFGAMLLAAVEIEARKRGKNRIGLHTGEANEGAHRFYERHGWRHIDTVSPSWAAGAMRIYQKTLSNAQHTSR